MVDGLVANWAALKVVLKVCLSVAKMVVRTAEKWDWILGATKVVTKAEPLAVS